MPDHPGAGQAHRLAACACHGDGEVVLSRLPDPGEVQDHGKAQPPQMVGAADAGSHEQLGSIDGARTPQDLPGSPEALGAAVLPDQDTQRQTPSGCRRIPHLKGHG
jgi:hypothetical protein